MSFIANVNLLAAGWAELEKFMKQYDGDLIKSLSALTAESVNLLAADLKLGTSNGDRKIDIDLTGNMVGTKEVAYESVTIELANGHTFSFAFPKAVSYQSYHQLIKYMADGIAAYNGQQADKHLHAEHYKLDIIYEVNGRDPKFIRVTDIPHHPTNIHTITLHVFVPELANAVDPAPVFTWATSTSALQMLIEHMPNFIHDTKVWQTISSKNPLPNSAPGALTNDGLGHLSWVNGQFIRVMSSTVDIKENYTVNRIDAAKITIGATIEVAQGGIPDAQWGITSAEVPTGSFLLYTGSHWLILDDSDQSRAVLDVTKHPHPKRGQLGYDKDRNRLFIALPKAPLHAGGPVTDFAWVDASPAMSAGDLSGILSSGVQPIIDGIESLKATTPKDIHTYVDQLQAAQNAASDLKYAGRTELTTISTELTRVVAGTTVTTLDSLQKSLDAVIVTATADATKVEVAALRTEITTVKGDLVTANNRIDSLETDMAAAKQQILNLHTAINNLPNTYLPIAYPKATGGLVVVGNIKAKDEITAHDPSAV